MAKAAKHDRIFDENGKEIILKTEHLSISFGGLKAVNDVNLEIKKGELYGLIGPNGAGKTTVFNLLTGIYTPTEGKIFLCGEDITGRSPMSINKAGIARTFQNIRLFSNLTVMENVMVGLSNQIPCSVVESIFRLPRHTKSEREYEKSAYELLKLFGLEEFKDHLASNLPYGKQRKLEIARAMATNPTLLLLDEPAAGMNPNETQELMNDISYIRQHFDMTILLIEHDMRLVSGICEQLTVLNFGTELAKGDTSVVLNDPEVVKAYLGE